MRRILWPCYREPDICFGVGLAARGVQAHLGAAPQGHAAVARPRHRRGAGRDAGCEDRASSCRAGEGGRQAEDRASSGPCTGHEVAEAGARKGREARCGASRKSGEARHRRRGWTCEGGETGREGGERREASNSRCAFGRRRATRRCGRARARSGARSDSDSRGCAGSCQGSRSGSTAAGGRCKVTRSTSTLS